MRRRTLLVSGGSLAVAGCLGSINSGNGSGPEGSGDRIASVSGTGGHTEPGIELDAGLTVVESHHRGQKGFKSILVGESGSETVFGFHVGAYDGADAALLSSGEYELSVEADGEWEIEIRQPRADEGDQPPDSLSGDRATVSGPYQFDGEYSATASHEGSGDFKVWVYPGTGEHGTLVFTDLGSFEGETTFEHEGIGWIDVEAAGEWTLTFE